MPAKDAPRVRFTQRDGVLTHTPFGEHFTLENFFINKKNVSPLAAAREVTKPQQKQSCNPLVYYGKSGSGKTHLLRAIANELACFYEYRAVFYGSIETLLQDARVFGANGYQAYCVDDMHLFANHIPLQETFNTFLDACLCKKKQLVCACSDTFYKGLPESLRARLKQGCCVQLKNPDIDVRMRFAQTQCLLHDFTIAKEHVLLLAQRCEHLRYLASVLLNIAAYKKRTQREITKQDVEKILRSTGEQKPMTPQDIICRVAEYFSLPPEEITGSRQEHALVFARQTAMYLCREILGASYPVLGQIFGGKNHSTVIYSIKKIKKYIIAHKNEHTEITKLKKICIPQND
jgi:chromosomal replication initiator protein